MARITGNHQGAFDLVAAQDIIDTDALQGPVTVLVGTADNIPAPNGQALALNGVRGGNFLINSASADAIVLAAPVAGTDDGYNVFFQDQSGKAHTITSTGNLVTANSGKTGVLTINGNTNGAGGYVSLRAYGGKWYVVAAAGVTYTS